MMRRLQASSMLLLLALGVLALAFVLAPASPASAQTLKLASLRVFHSDVVGPWVSYRVRTRSGRTPVREFTQRVAIVSREKVGKEEGYWVELKTVDRTGARIERGLFAAEAPRSEDDDSIPADSEKVADAGRPLRLVRYQMLAPGGKLYEYPVSSALSPRAVGGVSSYDLFEFDPSVKPIRRFLGPDTVRVGRWVVPAVLEWQSRAGTDDWAMMEDSTSAYRLVLTQTYWRNAAVSITGFARSLFRVTTRKVISPAGANAAGANPMAANPAGANPAAAHPAAPPDTSMVFAPADTTTGPTSMTPGEGNLLSWTELILDGIGADAVAEVTQAPVPAPTAEPTNPQVR